jgi:hypothetical protein
MKIKSFGLMVAAVGTRVDVVGTKVLVWIASLTLAMTEMDKTMTWGAEVGKRVEKTENIITFAKRKYMKQIKIITLLTCGMLAAFSNTNYDYILQKNKGSVSVHADRIFSGGNYFFALRDIVQNVLILSLIAIWMKFPELAIGMLIAHTIHLIGHIVNAVGVRRWSPGSITAVITLPLICFLIYHFVKTFYFGIGIDWLKMIAGFITASVILLGNLRLLHRFATKLNNWITNFYN